ncbi:MAG: hypothetical protein U0872_15605 [Planctomycetaceae bacterium]
MWNNCALPPSDSLHGTGARPAGSRFDPLLAYFQEQKIAAYNWGFVAGKPRRSTRDSWQKAYSQEPDVWFHEILHRDGKPYDAQETAYIRRITGLAT